MADYEINDVATIGLVEDIPAHQLPPEAWSSMRNVRVLDTQQVEKLRGWTNVFGAASTPPQFIMNLVDPSQPWWLYASLTEAYVFNGTSHTEITRASADYNASLFTDWDGTILGGIPIINNGVDPPQYCADYRIGTRLDDLPNWRANTTAKAMKAFAPYLVAVNITKAGQHYPHMVKWSHGAEVGAVPTSWDETDETKDAGENELHDTRAGMLLNAGMLRGQMYLYKEGSVWRIQQIGGRFIFRFDTFIDSNGLIGPKAFCLTPDGNKHVCLFQDDVVMHDGQQVKSVLEGRLKRSLFSRISQSAYKRCFLFANPGFSEVWICYPEKGFETPNRALIMNTVSGAITEAVGVDFVCADIGPVEQTNLVRWNTAIGTWDTYAGGAWGQIERRAVLVGNPTAIKIFQLDKGDRRNNKDFAVSFGRQGLSLMGQKRSREPIVDFKQEKLYTRVWIKATGVPFIVRLGVHEWPDGPISWSEAELFDPAIDHWCDFVQSGRAVAVEFSSTGPGIWRIHGYKPEIQALGNF